jgi:hypothetical protein
MECMSTMLMKLELPERQGPLPGTPNVEVVYDTSSGTAIRAAPLWFFIGEGLSLYGSLWMNTVNTKIYVVWATRA